jgi:hypothetical protein
MVKDGFLENKNSRILPMCCLSCYKSGHFTDKCPAIHYEADRISLIVEYDRKE